jgi:subtilisin family serine protease
VVKRRFESIGAELWRINGVSVMDAITRFKGDSRVVYIEPNYVVRAIETIPNDPRFDELWGMHNTGQTGGTPDADIDAPEAWDLAKNSDVLVGVIDTGVDYNHVDLSTNIFVNAGEIAGNNIDDDGNGFVDDVRGWDFINNDNNPIDDNGHGTHVSGTIGAIGNNGVGVVGVCWTVKIMPLKFLDAGGFGNTGDAIEAVEYATMMGAKLTSNSWGGGGFSQGLFDAIQAAGNAGALFIAAAGNASSNNDNFPFFPASYHRGGQHG